MIQQGQGFIINIGSMAAAFAVPFQSTYVSSKFALDGFTWALRNEVLRYGIKMVMVEPNDINTTIQPEIFQPEDSKYKNEMSKIMAARKKSMANANPPEIVAKKVVSILRKKFKLPVLKDNT